MHRRKMRVGSFIGILVLGLMVLALLIYTATRTLHFLQMMFPPDMQYVAYLALVAFDVGILGWTLFATTAAEGAPQRAISYAMIFVCVVGVVVATIADTALVSQQNGITKAPPNIATIGMWGSIIVIVLNVVAGICAHLFSPSHMRKFELESVHDEIHQLTIDHIKSRARDIMPQLAAENAEHWVRQTMSEVVGTLPHNANQQLPLARVVESDAPKSVAQAASRTHTVDPHQVRPQVDAEPKSLDKPNSLGQMLGSVHSGLHNAIDKVIDRRQPSASESPVEQPSSEEYSPEFEQALDQEIEKPIQELKPGRDLRTRRIAGDPKLEAQEDAENPS